MKPTAYKIGEGKWEGLSKDIQEVIGAYQEENKKLKEYIAWYEKEEGRLREENKKLREKLNKAGLEEYGFFNEY